MREDEIRARLCGSKIYNVIETIGREGDVLTLVLGTGDAVLIKADRLRLYHVQDYGTAQGGVVEAAVRPQET